MPEERVRACPPGPCLACVEGSSLTGKRHARGTSRPLLRAVGAGVSGVTSDPDTGHRGLSEAEDMGLIRTFLHGSKGSRIAAI